MTDAGRTRRVAVADRRRSSRSRDETPRAKTFRLALAASRRTIAPASTTSCASPRPTATPRRGRTRSRRRPTSSNEIELTVERLDDGEVSTFLHDEVVVGDELEVRGPIGGWFVWDGDAPALLVGGGSGSRAAHGDAAARAPDRRGPTSCGSSCRCARPTTSTTRDEIAGPETTLVYTRGDTAGVPAPARPARRATTSRNRSRRATRAYVCGSSGFADAASDVLLELGVPSQQIRVERFGPTG